MKIGQRKVVKDVLPLDVDSTLRKNAIRSCWNLIEEKLKAADVSRGGIDSMRMVFFKGAVISYLCLWQVIDLDDDRGAQWLAEEIKEVFPTAFPEVQN